MSLKFIAAVSLISTAFASGSIPSFGLQTAASIRSDLDDSAFKIDPDLGTIIETPDFKVRVADLTNFPALAGADVQAQVTRVTIQPGASFIRHHHPRASEVLNAIQGKMRVEFTFEGLSPRVVKNTIRPGQSTVFPQGLVHMTSCLSKTPCTFLSVFTSADPGLVPA